jgi:hypothetical protein
VVLLVEDARFAGSIAQQLPVRIGHSLDLPLVILVGGIVTVI